MNSITISDEKICAVASVLSGVALPLPVESDKERFPLSKDPPRLANAYLAIVAICHQTSPIGERPLEGTVNGYATRGWDYLRAKFLQQASQDRSLTTFDHWRRLRPLALSVLFEDEKCGKTLNGITERTYLLNDLGCKLLGDGFETIGGAFTAHASLLAGDSGFLRYLSGFHAYADPVGKKSHFFLSLAQTECGWLIRDRENLLSPVDYHELRGHLRIGTLSFKDELLARKIEDGVPLNNEDDIALRCAVQKASGSIAQKLSVSGSTLHYFLWNYFRNCCQRGNVRDCPEYQKQGR